MKFPSEFYEQIKKKTVFSSDFFSNLLVYLGEVEYLGRFFVVRVSTI